MRPINFKANIWKEGDYYVSQCLNVDVASFGSTRKEALANLEEALDLHLKDARTSKTGFYTSTSDFSRNPLRDWQTNQLRAELDESRLEIAAGKGKTLKSLKDLR